MASSCSFSFVCHLVILMILPGFGLYANGCYTSIISFGDSIADTGNLMALTPGGQFPCIPPFYGKNFYNQSVGRCSNGRLIIDFLAESLRLPLIPPYVPNKGKDNAVVFSKGVNFAVGGATVLNSSFLETSWIERIVINASLEVQLAWFKQSMPSLCGNTSDCRNFIGRSLILMGEIGGNDYSYPLLMGRSIKEAESYVPLIVDTVIASINELIEMGARTLVVPGNFPIGCSSSFLTTHGSDEEYDPINGCLVQLNEFAKFHNKLLQTKLNQIRGLHPNVIIMYADYYNAAMQFYNSPNEFGFTNGALKACCGGGGPFNYNLSAKCGEEYTTMCDQPDTYVNWDGVHLTEAAYKVIFKSLFQGSYTTPQFNSLCSTSTSQMGLGLSRYMYEM